MEQNTERLIIQGRSYNFFVVGNDIADTEDLNIYEKAICYQIARYSNNGNIAYPSYKTLAKKSGMSRDKAIKTVKALIEKGYLIKLVRPKGNGDNDSNIYALNDNIYKNNQDPSSCGIPPLVVDNDHPSSCEIPNKRKDINSNTSRDESQLDNSSNSSKDEEAKPSGSKKKLAGTSTLLKPSEEHIEINSYYISKENAKKGVKANNQKFIKNINKLIVLGYSIDEIKLVIDYHNEKASKGGDNLKYFRPDTIFGVEHFEKSYTFALEWKENKKNSTSISTTSEDKKYYVVYGNIVKALPSKPAGDKPYFSSEEEARASITGNK